MFRSLALVVLPSCVPHLPERDAPSSPSTWVAPTNRWPSATPPAELQATGFGEGEVPMDFRLPDQFAEEVGLWQFHGRLVIVDISPMWCVPCQQLAEGVEELVLEYAETDLVYVTLLAQDTSGSAPSAEDAAAWADAFGISSSPVVSDLEGWYLGAGPTAYPTIMGLGRDLRVFEPGLVPANLDADIRALIEGNL